jgi:hypothetical protein
MSEPRQIAVVRDYEDLVLALRERAEELGVNRLTLDEMTGLPNGYSAKLLSFPPIRVLGRVSLDLMLQALGLTMVLREDKVALQNFNNQRLKRQLGGKHAKPLRTKNGKLNFAEIMRTLGRRGGKARIKKMTKKQLTEQNRRNARRGWRRKRKEEKAKREASRVSNKGLEVLPLVQAQANPLLQCAGTGATIGLGVPQFPERQG